MTDNNNNTKKRERFFSSFLDAGVLASGCGSVTVTTLLGKPVTEEPILTKNKNKEKRFYLFFFKKPKSILTSGNVLAASENPKGFPQNK
jgi:hypothetical protein